MSGTIDLDAYLARIGLESAPRATAEGLETLQRAQRLSIPFENLDVRLGRVVRVTFDAVFVKLVTRHRGGYCFEQNRLLMHALQSLGFEVRPLLARVWLGAASANPPRTHTLSLVTIAGRAWLADAGFGGGYVPAMPIEDGMESIGPDRVRHRVRRDRDRGWVLSRNGIQGWEDQYSFQPDDVLDEEIEAANRWTAADPASRFVGHIFVSIALPQGYAAMTDRRLTVHDGAWSASDEIPNAEEYRALLHSRFGISLSALDVAQLRLFAQ